MNSEGLPEELPLWVFALVVIAFGAIVYYLFALTIFQAAFVGWVLAAAMHAIYRIERKLADL